MKKNLAIIVIILLLVITGFSLSRYFYLQKENFELQSVIRDNKAKIDDMVAQLMSQKDLNQKLLVQKEGLSNELKILSEQLKKEEAEISQVKDRLSSVQTKMNLLKKENLYLSALKASFDEKMELVKQDKEALEAKFNSIEELKKAICGLKEKMRQDRLAQKTTHKPYSDASGNRGYITWKGQPTLKSKIKIEVVPAS